MIQSPKSTGHVILDAKIMSVKHERKHRFVYFGIDKLCLCTNKANIKLFLVLTESSNKN